MTLERMFEDFGVSFWHFRFDVEIEFGVEAADGDESLVQLLPADLVEPLADYSEFGDL